MASLPFKDKHKTGFKSTRSGSFLKQWNIFFRQFLKHPGMIGSVIMLYEYTLLRVIVIVLSSSFPLDASSMFSPNRDDPPPTTPRRPATS